MYRHHIARMLCLEFMLPFSSSGKEERVDRVEPCSRPLTFLSARLFSLQVGADGGL